jgi:hypothetical protein
MTLDVNVSARYVKRERLISWLLWPKVNRHFGVEKLAEDLKVITSTQPKCLEYREGDIVYITYPGRLSSEAAARIRAQFDAFWSGKPPCKLLILDGDAQLGVLKRETTESPKCEN